MYSISNTTLFISNTTFSLEIQLFSLVTQLFKLRNVYKAIWDPVNRDDIIIPLPLGSGDLVFLL